VCVCFSISHTRARARARALSLNPPDPIIYMKIFNGQLRQSAPWELVPIWYETFPPDHIDQVEINNTTMQRKQKMYRMVLCRGSDPRKFNPQNKILNICTER